MGDDGRMIGGGMLSAAARSSPASDGDIGAHWRTPPALAEAIRVAFGLDPWVTDLAATRESALAPEYYGPDHDDYARRDGLSAGGFREAPSLGPVWCNPPYSRQGIDRWIRQCHHLSMPSRPVVTLVFVRTDCAWFHDTALPYASRLLFIRRRVRFLHPSDGLERDAAGAPSMAILWLGGRPEGEPPAVRGLE